jgi:hypothetical protein
MVKPCPKRFSPKNWKGRNEEEVERYIQLLGVRRWTELVIDREKWKDIVRQAKAHSGLQCQWKKKKKKKVKPVFQNVTLCVISYHVFFYCIS